MEFITVAYQPRIKIVRRNGRTIGQVKQSYEFADKWLAYKPGMPPQALLGTDGYARAFETKEDAAWALVDATPTEYQRAMAQEHAR